MRIAFDSDPWHLSVDNLSGQINTYPGVFLSEQPLHDPKTPSLWGSKPDVSPTITARQLENGIFIGRISLDKLTLTAEGFMAEGAALEEDSSYYPEGVYQLQSWIAER